jgi:hypothetical protein
VYELGDFFVIFCAVAGRFVFKDCFAIAWGFGELSNIHSKIHLTLRFGFILLLTSSTVCSSFPNPCRARKCGWSGIITSSAAARAFRVSSPNEGGQSIKA